MHSIIFFLIILIGLTVSVYSNFALGLGLKAYKCGDYCLSVSHSTDNQTFEKPEARKE
jgi:hypothetical protein